MVWHKDGTAWATDCVRWDGHLGVRVCWAGDKVSQTRQRGQRKKINHNVTSLNRADGTEQRDTRWTAQVCADRLTKAEWRARRICAKHKERKRREHSLEDRFRDYIHDGLPLYKQTLLSLFLTTSHRRYHGQSLSSSLKTVCTKVSPKQNKRAEHDEHLSALFLLFAHIY